MSQPILSIKVTYPGSALDPSYDDVQFLSDSIFGLNATYDAWCADRDTALDLYPTGAGNYSATLQASYYSTYEQVGSFASIFPSIETPDNLDEVNWLLNQHYSHPGNGYTSGEVQAAIWVLLGDSYVGSTTIGTVDPAKVQHLVDQANLHDGYVPDITDGDSTNDTIAVLLDTHKTDANHTLQQPLLIQTTSAALGDYVWIDGNADGSQDASEAGIDGVTVKLWRDLNNNGQFDANETLATATTGDNPHEAGAQHGYYQFAGLTPGLDYQVQFTAPNGYQFTRQDVGGDTTDSDANGNGLTSVVTLGLGEFNRTIDAGVYQAASLGDYVWIDTDGDGQQNEVGTGVNGVTVSLLDGNGNPVLDASNQPITTTTDGFGYYSFTGLVPGSYEVQFSNLPDGYLFTQKTGSVDDATNSDADEVTGITPAVTLLSGENNPNLDAGIFPGSPGPEEEPASLGDRLWLDANGNGVQDDGATGISGQTVTLVGGGADKVIGTADDTSAATTTGADGFYRFDGLTPGVEYQVQFSKPAGTFYTGQDLGGDDAKDSDADASGLSQVVVLASGEHNPTVDAGVYVVNPKIDIEKTTSGPSNTNPTAADYDNEDAANGAGVPILTPNTAVTWTYKVTNTGNTTFTKADIAIVDDNGTAGNTADDMTVLNGKITFQNVLSGNADNVLDPGESWLYKATGIVQNLTTISNTAAVLDFSGSSASTGTTGNIRTFTADGVSVKASAFSRDSGGTWGSAYLGSYSGGLGVTDGSESGSSPSHAVDNVGRVNYVLFEFDQNVVIDSTTLGWVSGDSDLTAWIGTKTNPFSNHLTLSDNLLSSLGHKEDNDTTSTAARTADLNAGKLSGNVLVIAASTSDTTPDDYFKIDQVKVQQVLSGVYENKGTVTAGGASDFDLSHYKNPAVVTPAKIGDFIWEDKNHNGVQDSGEAGIANVTVKLLDSSGATVLQTTTTDANGKYFFDVNAGTYKVQVVQPSGYYVTTRDQGSNDSVDSDINASGLTAQITVAAGQQDLTWDAGLYRKASVGDRVWEDWNHNNVQDFNSSGGAIENGIGNITVKLLDSTGTSVLATTKTDANGNYLFGNLDPGTYVLQFDKTNVTFSNSHWGGSYNMSTWKWAVKDALVNGVNNDAIDSDVTGNAQDATLQVTKTDPFTLVSGQNDMTRDAGITPIVIDLKGDGVHSVSLQDSQGTFDLFGNGKAINSGWLAKDDAFLAVDKNGNGVIDDISELFGGTAKGDGFAKLASYDSNGDGLVNADDNRFLDLSIWQDANGNHKTDSGELISLAKAGIASLNAGYTELPFLDGNGNIHLERSSATFENGKTVETTDLYFNVSLKDANAAGVSLANFAALLGQGGGQAVEANSPAAAGAVDHQAAVNQGAPIHGDAANLDLAAIVSLVGSQEHHPELVY